MDVYTYLHQDKHWQSERGLIEIQMMSPDHAGLAAQTLTKNATAMIHLVEVKTDAEAREGLAELSDVISLISQNPQTWIKNTPLYRSLSRVAQSR